MEILNLFKKTLNSFAKNSDSLMISFKNPIRVKLSFILNLDTEFSLSDADFISALEKKICSYNADNIEVVFHMNSIILQIDYLFNYLKQYNDEIVRACIDTVENHEDHLSDWSYWLTNWNPKLIMNPVDFDKGLEESLLLWKTETHFLRKVFVDALMMPPYSSTSDFWEMLKGQKSNYKGYMSNNDSLI